MTELRNLRIIRASSREKEDLLTSRWRDLQNLGFNPLYSDTPSDPQWSYAASSATVRAHALESALLEPGTAAVICARGGYGASDLLPLLNWKRLASVQPKLLIGFSDTSALQAALYSRLGWPSIHGPMPATTLWGKDGEQTDIRQLADVIHKLADGRTATGAIHLRPISNNALSQQTQVRGKLFGGCFSVLTNLIGTPWLPTSLKGHIVFFEDLDEHPARLMRHWNQWLQSGILDGVEGIVIGRLLKLGANVADDAEFVLAEWARRSPVPAWHSKDFGHTSPNFPLGIGAHAAVTVAHASTNNNLDMHWRLEWNLNLDQKSIS